MEFRGRKRGIKGEREERRERERECVCVCVREREREGEREREREKADSEDKGRQPIASLLPQVRPDAGSVPTTRSWIRDRKP